MVFNYSVPENKFRVSIKGGVSYDSDLDKVERVLTDVANEALRDLKGLSPNPRPYVRFTGFGDYSIDFELRMYVKEYADRRYVMHEMIKRIFKRFKEEGIEIPFPIRTLYVRQGAFISSKESD
jgi:small-conductance mechanosensitive channel